MRKKTYLHSHTVSPTHATRVLFRFVCLSVCLFVRLPPRRSVQTPIALPYSLVVVSPHHDAEAAPHSSFLLRHILQRTAISNAYERLLSFHYFL